MSSISFASVTKRFGEVVAADDVTLAVDDGEFMVLLGPSGCGKTTLLRLIAGLESVDHGELRIGDRVVNGVEAKDRDVAMVFQSYALYPHLSAFRNIESPLVNRKVSIDGGPPRRLDKRERAERVRETAELLQITGILGRKPAALSGGQRQRVALARAIVSQPAAFLMDEPLSNLDATLRVQTRLELAELQRRSGATVVYVTHDQVEAMTMATRLTVLLDGRVQQTGTPREVYEHPANLFVARFIGSPPMNTLDGIVAVGEDGPRVKTTNGTWATAPTTVGDGRRVVVGVRPEHLRLSNDGIAATVRAVEWLGSARHVHCDATGATLVVQEEAEGPDPSPGARVCVDADPRAVRLFDPETTELLG